MSWKKETAHFKLTLKVFNRSHEIRNLLQSYLEHIYREPWGGSCSRVVAGALNLHFLAICHPLHYSLSCHRFVEIKWFHSWCGRGWNLYKVVVMWLRRCFTNWMFFNIGIFCFLTMSDNMIPSLNIGMAPSVRVALVNLSAVLNI